MNNRQMKTGPYFRASNKAKPFYSIDNKADIDGYTDIFIYDEISWWGLSAEDFAKDLNEIEGNVRVRLNSPGGSVFDGMAIYNAIKQRKTKTITQVDGIAASAASVIFLAGDERFVSEGGFLMIHEPYIYMGGTATELRKEADVLDKISDQIVNIYSKRSEKSVSEIKEALKDETWLTGEEAIKWGFADSMVESEPVENMFNLDVFDNVPESLQIPDSCEMPDERELESILRDAGLSRKNAKALMAKGVDGLGLRDAESEPVQLDLKGISEIVNRVESLFKKEKK